MEPLEERSLLQFWGPRYWFTWLVYGWMRTVVLLPFSWQLWLGRRLGRVLHIVLYPRRYVAKQNIAACFPELSDRDRVVLRRRHFEAIGISVNEMSMVWFGSKKTVRDLIRVEGEEHLRDALELAHGSGSAKAAQQYEKLRLKLRDEVDGVDSVIRSLRYLCSKHPAKKKLATELTRTGSGLPSLLVLDEPSTGLSATDTVPLAHTFRRLARRGDAVVLIEHHTELLGICDRLVELGPGGGEAGGRVIGSGTPEELAANPESVTGPWLGRGPAVLRRQRVERKKRVKREPVRQEKH